MKITTLDQFENGMERIADTFIAKGAAIEVDLVDYLKKTDAANTYVAKDGSKVLSTNDFTTAEKTKLAGIAENANNYTLPTANASTLGGVKLYTGTGNNTDGTMTQAAIKTALDAKLGTSDLVTNIGLTTTAKTTEGAMWVVWS